VIKAERKLSPFAGQFPNGMTVLGNMLKADMHKVSEELATPSLLS